MKFYRSPKTLNESRALASAAEAGVKVRPARVNLPDAWNDLPFACWGHRSWKQFRAKQYR